MLHGRKLVIKVGGVAVAMSRSCSINCDCDLIEVSTPTVHRGRKYISGRKGWSIDVNYLVVSDSAFVGLMSVGSVVDVSAVVLNDSGIIDDFGPIVSGEAIIKNARVTATVGNLVQGEFSLQGNGDLANNPNILPSLTFGWESTDGAGVVYLPNYGIRDKNGDLFCPVVAVSSGTRLCFSIDGDFAPASVIFCWITNNNYNHLSDIYENGQTLEVYRRVIVVDGVERGYYTMVVFEDCKLTVNITTDNIVSRAQLEVGNVPSVFYPV